MADFVVITDELMLELDNWNRAAARAQTFSAEQQAALERLDSLFDPMSSTDAADFATETALREHPLF